MNVRLPDFFKLDWVQNPDHWIIIVDVIVEDLIEASTDLTADLLPSLPVESVLLSDEPLCVFDPCVAKTSVI